MNHQASELILASSSPRRQELLEQLGIAFTVLSADIDETPCIGENPEEYVKRMAREKASALTDTSVPILAADTSVVVDGQIFGKPRDRDHAQDMLAQLSGRAHQVMSAVALRTDEGLSLALSQTCVVFRKLSQQEIVLYCETGEPIGKAGAYAIQGMAALFIEQITGSYSGVMGLPLYETGRLLVNAGFCLLQRKTD